VIRAAIVGLGNISLEHLKKLSALDDVNVVGVCDISPTLARAVAARFPGVQAYEDFERMLTDLRPEVVHVLTPPQAHRDLVLTALEHGAHVFVEKPIAPSFDDYTKMRDAARSRGLLLCENYNYLFGRGVRAALDTVNSGVIGDVVNVDVSFGGVMNGAAYADHLVPHFAHALPGGALQNFITHPVSISLAFIGLCTNAAVIERRLDADFLSNDELRALLHGTRGCAVATVSRHTLPHFELSVHGTLGRVEVDVYTGRIGVGTTASSLRRELGSSSSHLAAGADVALRTVTGRRDAFEGLGKLLGLFYAAVRDHGDSPISVDEMDAVNAVVAGFVLHAQQAA
jgi:predicted dehydrogenase